MARSFLRNAYLGWYRAVMTKLCYITLALTGVLMACSGSQKAPPDSAATQASESASASSQAPARAEPSEVPPAKDSKVDVEPAPTGPECKKTEDCTIFADCCSCKAVPASKASPVPCESICGESKCEVKGMTIANVACENERCVLKKK
jgi:hypothetical protein